MIAIIREIMITMGSESKPPPQKSSYEQNTDRPNQKKTRILDTFIRNAWVSSSNWPFKTVFKIVGRWELCYAEEGGGAGAGAGSTDARIKDLGAREVGAPLESGGGR